MIFIFFLAVMICAFIVTFSYLMFGWSSYITLNLTISFLASVYVLLRLFYYIEYLKKKMLMFSFIELFLLNFDIQKTIPATLSVVFPLLSIADQKVLNNKRKTEGVLFLESLSSFFAHTYYESFLGAVNLVNERGGDIMQVSEILLFSIANSQAQLLKINRIDNSYIIKFIFNWLFIFAVGLLFRFALDGFLLFQHPPLTFIIGIEVFIMLFLMSVILVIENRIRRIKHVT